MEKKIGFYWLRQYGERAITRRSDCQRSGCFPGQIWVYTPLPDKVHRPALTQFGINAAESAQEVGANRRHHFCRR